MKFTKHHTGVMIYAWERNTVASRMDQPFLTHDATISFKFSSIHNNGSNQVVEHSFAGQVLSEMVTEAFTNTAVFWDKDKRSIECLEFLDEKTGEVTRSLVTPYNPTLEQLAGIMYCLCSQMISVTNFNNSECSDLKLESVRIFSNNRNEDAEFTFDDLNRGHFFSGAQFKWSSTVTEFSNFDIIIADIYKPDFRIDIPVNPKDVDPYA